MNTNDAKERRIAWTILILGPLSMAVMFAYVTLGYAPGLEAGDEGHPMIYLQMTCLLWAIIMTVIPILRLTRAVALPLWFTAIVYGHMYLYVISLCQGMYLDIAWWGDFTHIIASLIVSALVFIGLCLMESRSPKHVTFGSNKGLLVMLFLVAMSFGGIWELMEGFTDFIGGNAYMIYGSTDTVADITADLAGATIMVIIASQILKKQGAEGVASKVRLGRNSIEY